MLKHIFKSVVCDSRGTARFATKGDVASAYGMLNDDDLDKIVKRHLRFEKSTSQANHRLRSSESLVHAESLSDLMGHASLKAFSQDLSADLPHLYFSLKRIEDQGWFKGVSHLSLSFGKLEVLSIDNQQIATPNLIQLDIEKVRASVEAAAPTFWESLPRDSPVYWAIWGSAFGVLLIVAKVIS